MKKWSFYTTNEIKPRGWLRDQLIIQANGLGGKLDKVWRDVRDSKWIGGRAEGWERVPYWLDGFIPLAYILEDEDMIERANRYVRAIIASQQNDGWICPCKGSKRALYDTWAVQLITKVLYVYYECSGDESVLDVIYKVLKNYYELLSNKKIKLFNWGKYRWFECFIAINLIYDKCGEQWLCELAKILREQGKNYDAISYKWLKPKNIWTFETHIVNLAMMLKSEAVSCDILGEAYTDSAQKLYNLLYQHNGTPVGLFTGDECLSGISPIQGTELCAVVEQMYSYELLFAYTGEHKWAERLELLAFNALPAAFSDDMWAHQYVQMSNQIACQKIKGKPIFRTNSGEAHLFGLEPHFGCCTANFSQGFPKLALSCFMHSENEVISVLPLPSELKTPDKHIIVDTKYPFENRIKYTVESRCAFDFVIRLESFAEELQINGEDYSGSEYTVHINSGDSITIDISFETTPRFEKSLSSLSYAKCGSLIFCVPIEYKKKKREYTRRRVERKFPYCDYEYIPQSRWSFAYCNEKLKMGGGELTGTPFSSDKPPVTLLARVCEIDWGLEGRYKTICARLPKSTTPKSEPEAIELYPYGCSKLRVTELPMVR